MLPEYSFPHEAAIRINLPVLIFSVVRCARDRRAVRAVAGVAAFAARSRPGDAVQYARRSRASISGRTMNKSLIAGQIALTLVMLAGAGAAMQGFLKLMHTPLGYDPHNVMSVGIPVHDGTYTTLEARTAYFEELRTKVAYCARRDDGGSLDQCDATVERMARPSVEILGKPARTSRKFGSTL